MSLRHQPCFQELADDLRRFAGDDMVTEIVNSGNWGDALIHAGQAAFLADVGISVDPVPIGQLRKNKFHHRFMAKLRGPRHKAIVTGSGAFRDFYNRPDEIAIAASRFANVFVMPSSFPFRPKLDPERTIFWRRDALESLDGLPEARFCHDMAFYLQPKPRKATKRDGILFRTDIERVDVELPASNVDLSNEGTHRSDIEPFLDRIGDFEVIHTNRLHVGIGGALLGREVHLYASRTRKLESIFKSSLEPFYDNVHYHSDEADIARMLEKAQVADT
ncbi:polysaccharide pyruvyl transferase family protein [Dinoroseobacter sp. S375]|uniref:polysaccharide pyruvyl transferase family protein n=1 Tax=Dinoroseobacter sp. S375 TaxID=3415136 RepID=UPI003C7A3AD1